jgi:hypothetical protein
MCLRRRFCVCWWLIRGRSDLREEGRKDEERRRNWMSEREDEEQRKRNKLAIKEREENKARETIDKALEKEEYETKN